MLILSGFAAVSLGGGGGGYLVYFAAGMCTASRVSFLRLLSNIGYQKKTIFLERVVNSVCVLFFHEVFKFCISREELQRQVKKSFIERTPPSNGKSSLPPYEVTTIT